MGKGSPTSPVAPTIDVLYKIRDGWDLLLGIYLILLFPDGRLPSRRWRPLAWLSGVVMVLASVVSTLAPGPLEGHPGVRNPYGLEGLEGYTWAESAVGRIGQVRVGFSFEGGDLSLEAIS